MERTSLYHIREKYPWIFSIIREYFIDIIYIEYYPTAGATIYISILKTVITKISTMSTTRGEHPCFILIVPYKIQVVELWCRVRVNRNPSSYILFNHFYHDKLKISSRSRVNDTSSNSDGKVIDCSTQTLIILIIYIISK